ncbi:methyltransferase domain-containing protein [Candidatus Poribacteria bacterium]|nr:methyltransferase domain-containing protein [Candidatus Poribacteria bacterium]
MPGFKQIIDIVNGYWPAQTLLVANEYDIFTLLTPKGKSAKDISKISKTNLDAIEKLLNALVALKLLNKKNNLFFNTPVTNKFLVKNKKDYRGEFLKHHQDLWNSWNNLNTAIKFGFSEDFLKNKNFLRDKSRVKAFIHGLHNVGEESAIHVAKNLPLEKVKHALDLGGGGGTFSIAIVNENKKVKCTIFDLPEILEVTKEIIKENKKEKNINTCTGNFNKDTIPDNFDLILISKVTHVESPKNNIEIFKKCFKALNPGGKIAIHDFMLDKTHTKPLHSVLFALNMLVRTPGGGVYSADEYKEWLRIAGFNKFKLYKIPHQTELLIATKKIGT